ncbi:hypothetical protein Back2_12070 [Nocardioides baekrokdamisoli]|uniref:Lipoprotein n=1 Tax=Nocardioides baekrokdamisoli TaxID=1804624 RepID=A0A3G9ID69_9ACTN|nr:hypothetical protein [Nocardioides baekrokdamisoli]BBH16920.1 hypothetical protein Back2_12070 [Nocardioides baekrokdamisoli]
MKLRHAGLALLAIPLALTSACSTGGSSPQVASLQSPGGSSTPSASTPGDQALAFAQCVRAHGGSAPDPGAEPSSGGHLITMSPADLKANQACSSLLNTGQDSVKANEDARKADLQMAACMRKNGISNWPDPLPPGSSPARPADGGSVMTDLGGTFVLPPDIKMSSPRVQKAQSVCQPGMTGHSFSATAGSAGH